ncbi:MAG: ADP-ribosylglycohydrolase family protein [Gemmatimonadota bacterium]
MSTDSGKPHPLRDRFRGALLGTLLGDALGMPVEGWPAALIRRELGEVREMHEARLGAGTYTDDTQMAGALAEGLLGSPDPSRPEVDRIARRFGERYDPERGYGGNTRQILAAIRAGRPWREVVEEHRLPGGSFANGAAMRVAPAALAGYPDPAVTVAIADLQARPTGHDHPEGRFGARLQALGVLACLREGRDGPPPDPRALLRSALEGWEGLAPEGFVNRLEWIAGQLEEAGGDTGGGTSGGEEPRSVRDGAAAKAIAVLGTGGRAVESVPAALWAFLSHPDDPEEAIITAVGLGGDTDTIGAMAGALAGARCGASSLPARWLEAAEEGPGGRGGLTELADRLYERIHERMP